MNKEAIWMQAFAYHLPPERIAGFPLPQRDDAKLLVYKSGRIEEDHFHRLAQQLPAGATLVLNNTRVIEARLFFTKPTGGLIEIFCLEPAGQSMEVSLQQQGTVDWTCLIGGASKWKPGQLLQKEVEVAGRTTRLTAEYKGKQADGFLICFSWTPPEVPFAELLHAAGQMPLPPYIKRQSQAADKERYQTIFAETDGSVAAPTAALHFTERVFADLAAKGVTRQFVTLNVGAGTFKPVKAAAIADHTMHSETFSVRKDTLEAILEATMVVAVGTTSLRTLESLHWLGVKQLNGLIRSEWTLDQWEVYDLDETISYRESLTAVLEWMEKQGQDTIYCRTALLIVPGYRFHIPTALITNFHQPQSTLLLLIAAFIGDDWKKVYQYALDNDFRFLSYGDSSLLWRAER